MLKIHYQYNSFTYFCICILVRIKNYTVLQIRHRISRSCLVAILDTWTRALLNIQKYFHLVFAQGCNITSNKQLALYVVQDMSFVSVERKVYIRIKNLPRHHCIYITPCESENKHFRSSHLDVLPGFYKIHKKTPVLGSLL